MESQYGVSGLLMMKNQINVLELLAIKLAIQTFSKTMKLKTIQETLRTPQNGS